MSQISKGNFFYSGEDSSLSVAVCYSVQTTTPGPLAVVVVIVVVVIVVTFLTNHPLCTADRRGI